MSGLFGRMFGSNTDSGFIPDGQTPPPPPPPPQDNQNNQQQSQQQGQQATNTANATQQNATGQQTNSGNDDSELYSKLWQSPQADNGNGQQGQQNTAATNDPMAVLRAHLEGKQIFKDIDFSKLVGENNPENWKAAMNQIVTNTYTATMQDMSGIMGQKIQEAVNDAVKRSRNVVTSDYAISQLQSAHPYLKNPAVAPVANQVMLRAMQEGREVSDAIKFTHNYFVGLGRAATGQGPQNNSPDGQRGGNQTSNTDWMQYLTNS